MIAKLSYKHLGGIGLGITISFFCKHLLLANLDYLLYVIFAFILF